MSKTYPLYIRGCSLLLDGNTYTYQIDLLISGLQRTVDIAAPLGLLGCRFILKPDGTGDIMRKRERILALKSFMGNQINIKFLLTRGENYIHQDRHIYLFVSYDLSEKIIQLFPVIEALVLYATSHKLN